MLMTTRSSRSKVEESSPQKIKKQLQETPNKMTLRSSGSGSKISPVSGPRPSTSSSASTTASSTTTTSKKLNPLSEDENKIFVNCKRRITSWENNFNKVNGKNPSANDMKLAPRAIKDSYAQYLKLKKKQETAPATPKGDKAKKIETNTEKFFGGVKINAQNTTQKKKGQILPRLAQNYSFSLNTSKKRKFKEAFPSSNSQDETQESTSTTSEPSQDAPEGISWPKTPERARKLFKSMAKDYEKDKEITWPSSSNPIVQEPLSPERNLIEESIGKGITLKCIDFDTDEEEITWPILEPKLPLPPRRTFQPINEDLPLPQEPQSPQNQAEGSLPKFQWDKKPEKPKKFFKSRNLGRENTENKKYDHRKAIIPSKFLIGEDEEKKSKKKALLSPHTTLLKKKEAPPNSTAPSEEPKVDINAPFPSLSVVKPKRRGKGAPKGKAGAITSRSKVKGSRSIIKRTNRSATKTKSGKKAVGNIKKRSSPRSKQDSPIPGPSGTSKKPRKSIFQSGNEEEVEGEGTIMHADVFDVDEDQAPRQNKSSNARRPMRGKSENYVKINIERKVFVRGHKGFSRSKARQKEIKEKYRVMRSVVAAGKKRAGMARVENNNAAFEETVRLQTVPNFFEATNDVYSRYSQLEEALGKFGYEEFRTGQREAILKILNGESCLAILSTGSGKSLIYQMAAYLHAQRNPEALTLVISPLVSLMDDQCDRMPEILRAGCLHSNMTSGRKEKVLEKIRRREINILLISPEAICGGVFGLMREGFPPITFACIDEAHCVSQWSHNFRPSYFRVCKLLREKLGVRTFLGLTATATRYTALNICSHLNIAESNIIQGEIIPPNLNLSVSSDKSRDQALITLLNGPRFEDCDSVIIYCTRQMECERISALLRVNLQHLTKDGKSYKKVGRNQISNTCECYHAGLSAYRRRTVQTQFMNGEIRVVVATISFGMGLDKSDIRAVIHYNMPKSFESYVQEIGRAGRDGKPAQCHLFLDHTKEQDLLELRRHVYTNSIDRSAIRGLLNKIFVKGACKRGREYQAKVREQKAQTSIENNPESLEKVAEKPPPEVQSGPCPWHEVSINVSVIIEDLNVSEQTITTLLCYLELNQERKWIEQYPHSYERCKIHSYVGPKLFETAAATCPALAAGIHISKKFKPGEDSYVEFNVFKAASLLGCSSSVFKRELKQLEWTRSEYDEQGNPAKWAKSGLLVEFDELAFRVLSPCDLSKADDDSILRSLQKHVTDQEKVELYQLNKIYNLLQKASSSTVEAAVDGFDLKNSEFLKEHIGIYFNSNTREIPTVWKHDVYGREREEDIKDDLHSFLREFSAQDKPSARSIAKIFQGISTPNYPAEYWARNKKYWRQYINVEFNTLCEIISTEMMISNSL